MVCGDDADNNRNDDNYDDDDDDNHDDDDDGSGYDHGDDSFKLSVVIVFDVCIFIFIDGIILVSPTRTYRVRWIR